MRKIQLYGLITLFAIFSCNSGNEDNSQNSDNEIIDIGSEAGNEQSESDNNELNDDAESELDAEFKDFLQNFEMVSLPYKVTPDKEFDSKNIPLDNQVKFLTKPEGLDKSELEQMQDYAKFYYIANPIHTSNFQAIVYGRYEMNSSYYILCTFDNKGKAISFIDFAMHQIIGAGPQAGQEYTMSGEIDNNMKITVKSDESTKTYQIQDDGKIVKK